MSAFDVDDKGRTVLFHYAATGNRQAVEKLIFSLTGTGMAPQRLALIAHRDSEGQTAADIAEKAGYGDIANLLHGEQGRMEYFE